MGNISKQPCWDCRKSCGGCDWSREFKPIKGWEATETLIKYDNTYTKSYKIKKCPEFERDIIIKKEPETDIEKVKQIGISRDKFYRMKTSCIKLEKIRSMLCQH